MIKIMAALLWLLWAVSSYSLIVSNDTAAVVANNWWERIAGQPASKITCDKLDNVYIARIDDKGWILVSSSDTYRPVIAYATNSDFPLPVECPAVNDWLYFINSQITASIEYSVRNSGWDNVLSREIPTTTRNVDPLLTTKWNQFWPYNELCPPGCAAGCTAAAFAQCLKYWNHPIQGQGYHSYYLSGIDTLLEANFGETTYNWANMPNVVSQSNLDVATLYFHCGVSVNMSYGPLSGASLGDIPPASINYFKYDPSIIMKIKSTMTDIQWRHMLMDELDYGRPIPYAGFGTGAGHAFVCDGYQDSLYFHFNWGFSGSYDGYYTIDDLTPGSYNFTTYQFAVISMFPLGIQRPLPPNNVHISIVNNSLVITWDPVTIGDMGTPILIDSYSIYASDNAYDGFTAIGNTSQTIYTLPLSSVPSHEYFKIVAIKNE